MIKQGIMLTEIPRSSIFVTRGHTTRVILTVKICIFEQSNEKNNFRKLKYIFTKKLHQNYWDILGYKL